MYFLFETPCIWLYGYIHGNGFSQSPGVRSKTQNSPTSAKFWRRMCWLPLPNIMLVLYPLSREIFLETKTSMKIKLCLIDNFDLRLWQRVLYNDGFIKSSVAIFNGPLQSRKDIWMQMLQFENKSQQLRNTSIYEQFWYKQLKKKCSLNVEITSGSNY